MGVNFRFHVLKSDVSERCEINMTVGIKGTCYKDMLLFFLCCPFFLFLKFSRGIQRKTHAKTPILPLNEPMFASYFCLLRALTCICLQGFQWRENQVYSVTFIIHTELYVLMSIYSFPRPSYSETDQYLLGLGPTSLRCFTPEMQGLLSEQA